MSHEELPRYAVYQTEAMLRSLEADGFALVSDALAPGQCEEARAKIDALCPRHWDEAQAQGGRHMDRYLCVFNRDPYWLDFIDRPGIIDLAEAALGADCHIIGETAWRSHPGYRGDPLHVDYLPGSAMEGEPRAQPLPLFILTAHFYLCDLSPELAPTRIVPGSHRAVRAPRAEEWEWNGRVALPVLARAGDCLVFRSDLWHAGSDNRTAQDVRYLLQVHYGRREMAQHFSPYLEWRFDPRVIAAATARHKRLLGDHPPGPYD